MFLSRAIFTAFDYTGQSGASEEATDSLKRNTFWLKQDFVVMPPFLFDLCFLLLLLSLPDSEYVNTWIRLKQ